jgi:hypothetical protein
MATKCTKCPKKYTIWPSNRQNGDEKYRHLPLQDVPKFTQIGIFGLKIFHLPTLVQYALTWELGISSISKISMAASDEYVM